MSQKKYSQGFWRSLQIGKQCRRARDYLEEGFEMAKSRIGVYRTAHLGKQHGSYVCNALRVLDYLNNVLKMLVGPFRILKAE